MNLLQSQKLQDLKEGFFRSMFEPDSLRKDGFPIFVPLILESFQVARLDVGVDRSLGARNIFFLLFPDDVELVVNALVVGQEGAFLGMVIPDDDFKLPVVPVDASINDGVVVRA